MLAVNALKYRNSNYLQTSMHVRQSTQRGQRNPPQSEVCCYREDACPKSVLRCPICDWTNKPLKATNYHIERVD